MYLYVIENKKDIEPVNYYNEDNEFDNIKYFCFQPNKNIGLFENELNDNDYKILYKYKIELGKEFKHSHESFIFVDQNYRLIKEWLDLHFTFNYYLQLKLNDFVEYKFKRLSDYKIIRHFEIIE